MATAEPPRPNYPRLTLTFGASEAGWIPATFSFEDVAIKLPATHMADPFLDMLRWLEAIISGAEAAKWVVDHEGYCTQLVYVAAPKQWLGAQTPARLIVLEETGAMEVGQTHVLAVMPEDLVATFYRSFRDYVEDGDYIRSEWEPVLKMDYGPPDPEEWGDHIYPWDGAELRLLRSDAVETYLAEATWPRPGDVE